MVKECHYYPEMDLNCLKITLSRWTVYVYYATTNNDGVNKIVNDTLIHKSPKPQIKRTFTMDNRFSKNIAISLKGQGNSHSAAVCSTAA